MDKEAGGTRARSGCSTLLLKTTEGQKDEAAKEISVAAGVASVLSELDSTFYIKRAPKSFLWGQHRFLLLTGFGKSPVKPHGA